MKKVTVLGGGTGSFVILSGLKHHQYDLSAIVTMMDSGGSTGRLRDQLGVLPPGDLRQCLVALSEAPDLWRKLFLYRFENGDLDGHNFGNIFLSALEKVSDNYNEVVKSAEKILHTKGSVIPVTMEKAHLCVKHENGTIIKGEGIIDENYTEQSKIVEAFLEPKINANPRAIKRIQNSDVIIIGPGDLYTSIIPVLLVDNIKQALMSSKAKIIFVMNLMTKSGQTTNYTAQDYIDDLQIYLGRVPDDVLVNNGEIPSDILQWYKSHHEYVVSNNLKSNYSMNVILEDVVDKTTVQLSASDKLSRSILRHSSDKLAQIISQIIT
ncbi:MAG: gluconeogenesis factor YvcK family protein [Candidatus Roizmanbacteria bacterium]